MLQRTRKDSLALKMIIRIAVAVITSQGSQVAFRKER